MATKEQISDFYRQHVSDLVNSSTGNSAQGYCPFHGDKNKKSFSVSLLTGQYNCFSGKCGKTGNALVFARELSINPPSWSGGKDWNFIYSKMLNNNRDAAREYLLGRGLPAKYLDYLDEVNLYGFDVYNEEAHLTFPLFSEGIICGLNKVNIDDDSKKVHGAMLNSYWIDTNFDFTGTVFVVEAVINAMTLNALGFKAMAIVSSMNVIAPEIFTGMDVILAFDNDAAGRKIARTYTKNIENIAHTVKCVVWDVTLKKGFDINDIINDNADAPEYISKLQQNAVEVDEWGDYKQFWRSVNG